MFARRALTINVTKRTSAKIMGVRFNSNEGATGAARPSGSEDSFRKRERAQEDLYMRSKQAEEIAALKAQLAKQKAQLDRIEKDAKEEN